jgi:hypothetical protein
MRTFDAMFKRSFTPRDGRIVKSKPTKVTYPEHVKRKMQDTVDAGSPVARCAANSRSDAPAA